MLNRHSKLKESGCPPSVGRLFVHFEIETRDLIILSAKTWRWLFRFMGTVHPAMQMWMRVTAVCQKIRAMADTNISVPFDQKHRKLGVVQKQPILGNKSSRI